MFLIYRKNEKKKSKLIKIIKNKEISSPSNYYFKLKLLIVENCALNLLNAAMKLQYIKLIHYK